MALDPLASADDLTARGITVPAEMDSDALLATASAQVREAAGCAISSVTSTVSLSVRGDNEYLTLPGLVTAVDSAEIDGVAVTDYTVVDNQLWRFGGWRMRLTSETSFFLPRDAFRPSLVTVTYTHGLAEVPADIVDLVCELVARRGAQGYEQRVTSEAVDDYRVTYDKEGTPTLTTAARDELRRRFGASAYVTTPSE